jgi:hypothetical protein
MIHKVRAGFSTPSGLLLRAAFLLSGYLAASLAGLREFTGALSFSMPSDVPPALAAVGCATYLVLYFASVIVAPILVIGAGLLAIVNRFA